MRQSLFRQEVIQKQSNRLQGNVLLIPNVTHSMWVGVTCFFVLAIILWLSLNTYTQIKSVDGWVSDAPASNTSPIAQHTIGQTLKEGEPLKKEISSELQASYGEKKNLVGLTLLLDVEDVGIVKPDQKIKIQFVDLPVQKFGEYTATVVNVDDHLSLPGDFSSAPFRPTSPVYKVYAKIDNEQVTFHDVKITLRENMQLSATLTSEKQPLYRWLVDSLSGNKTGTPQ